MTGKIPFLDLKRQYALIKGEVEAALKEVCRATAFASGPFVEEFERNFARYCAAEYCAAVNSGTSALHLCMRALGIGAGDEVILPANTFIATAWAVSYVNATPVFVDCTADTWNIDPARIEEKITGKTRAIIGVHLYGQPFDLDAVSAIARRRGLFLVEDCAQAHGAEFKGKRVGGFGEMGCFSFYPGKNLGAYGEGGAVVTDKEEYDRHIRSLRDHGSPRKYYHDEIGYNMRMDGFQGAVLNIKLKYLDSWNGRRKEIAGMYRSGITNSKIGMQRIPAWADPVFHLFVVVVEERDRLIKFLNANNVFPGMHYPIPCHLQKAYSYLGYRKGDCPQAEYLSDHCLSLPMFPEMTDEEVGRTIELLNAFEG